MLVWRSMFGVGNKLYVYQVFEVWVREETDGEVDQVLALISLDNVRNCLPLIDT